MSRPATEVHLWPRSASPLCGTVRFHSSRTGPPPIVRRAHAHRSGVRVSYPVTVEIQRPMHLARPSDVDSGTSLARSAGDYDSPEETGEGKYGTSDLRFCGGAKGTRTPDPHTARSGQTP